jgi:erythromycin esterase-like protein
VEKHGYSAIALESSFARYNADPSHSIKLHFYGFDAPTEMSYADSPPAWLCILSWTAFQLSMMTGGMSIESA